MKASLLIGLLASALIASAEETDTHGKSSERLIDLNTESFDQTVIDPKTNMLVGGPWLIMFFAPWCGHCKRLMPTFDQFAEEFGDGQALNVGRVNCDEGSNNNLCTAYDVAGFPTVLFIQGDYFYEYRGERSVAGFKKFVFEGGFEQAESDHIPVKLEGMALY